MIFEEIIQKILTEHFGDDGLHLEHSPDYHLILSVNPFTKKLTD